MSKKLLNEAQVRRFMGLAGVRPSNVDSVIKEMYGKSYEEEKEEVNEMAHEVGEEKEEIEEEMIPEPAEAAHVDEEDVEMDMDADEPAGAADVELDEDEVSSLVSALEAAMPVLDKLKGAIGAEGDAPAPEAELEPVEDELAGEEAPEDMMQEEDLAGVNLELSEEEIVQEVSRRVAKRIMEAKKAHDKLNKALGK